MRLGFFLLFLLQLLHHHRSRITSERKAHFLAKDQDDYYDAMVMKGEKRGKNEAKDSL